MEQDEFKARSLSEKDKKIIKDMMKDKDLHFQFLYLIQHKQYLEAKKLAKLILKKEPDNIIIKKFSHFLEETADELPYLEDDYVPKDSDNEEEDSDEWEYYEEGEWEAEQEKKKKNQQSKSKQNLDEKSQKDEKEESEWEEWSEGDEEDEDDEYEYYYEDEDEEEDYASKSTDIATTSN